MQEPVSTDNEMEDVLSSIRRLVAQGGRRSRPEGGDTPRQEIRPVGKLVLTPDCRIGEGTGKGAAPEGGQPAARTEDPALAGETAENTPENAPAAAESPLSERTSTSIAELEKTILELEAAIGEQDIEFEPDGSEDPAQEAATSVPLPRLRRQAEEATEATTTDAGEVAAATPAPALPGESEETPEGRLPGFASARASRKDETAEGGADPDDAARQASPAAQPSPDTDTDADSDAVPQPALVADLVADEETLRRIVREVLQEELRGDLGLRITRNVRKLVRREINRTLESLGIE